MHSIYLLGHSSPESSPSSTLSLVALFQPLLEKASITMYTALPLSVRLPASSLFPLQLEKHHQQAWLLPALAHTIMRYSSSITSAKRQKQYVPSCVLCFPCQRVSTCSLSSPSVGEAAPEDMLKIIALYFRC